MKESKASLLPTSSHQATLLHFITVLPWFDIKASHMANLKEKEKNDVSFSRFLDFCVFLIHTFQNLWRYHKHCYIMEVTLVLVFFLILSPIKMKLGQKLVFCKKNIFNIFLAQCLRLETSSRPFYDFIKMTI